MHVAYWIVAGLLAALYLYSGAMKLTRSREQLAPMMQWVETTPMPAVRLIGAVELLGALGLILPPLLDVAPVLALVAAVGFVLVQVGAIVVHLRRDEAKVIGFNVVLLVLAAVAAWLATSFV
ncbi:DoxX family protein [Luteimicrobium subarcticum]|uniref:DoxX-like protein n=1 Tax=Luteimicrobium subarcticum TaxID=620910 RepID=A0A2M8W1M3_9MICO|nr:DoxX family protein [Luteimicrobium subarcticum]PJI84809.1 DoxX-like protein [Luteimicrobium subarcticum]